jgi:hypothetical protein
MGVILDDITAFSSSIAGGGFEALPAESGQSLSLRWLGQNTKVELLEAWGGTSANKADFSIRSPLLHDNTRSIRFAHQFNPTLSGADGNPQLYLPPFWKQPYEPTDTLIVEISGTAGNAAVFTQLIKYESPDIQGARLLGYNEVESRLKNLIGIRVSPSASGTAGVFGTAEAINSDDDRLKANTDYALLGLTTDAPFTTLEFYGPDTANFACAMPGHWSNLVGSGWFYEMSKRWNEPLIPVINSNNKGVTYTRIADVTASTSPLISLLFAELS